MNADHVGVLQRSRNDNRCASGSRPHARAIAVTKTGSVENDDSEMFRRKINQTELFGLGYALADGRGG
jgi:hypothetical protein